MSVTGELGLPVSPANVQRWGITDGLAWTRLQDAYDPIEGVTKLALLVWDPVALGWVKMTQPGGSGGGGGGPATIADGADVTQGAKADTAWDGLAASPTIVAIDKAMWAKLEAVRALLAGTLSVAGGVTVSNFPASQAVTGPLTDTQLRASVVPVDVSDRDVRLAGRVKHLDSAGTVIDPALKGQLPAALVGGRLDVNLGGAPATVPTSSAAASQVDGHSATIGATTDAATATTLIGRLQKLVALLAGGLPAALGRTTMAGSLSVALASDQANVQVQQQSSTLIVSGQGTANTSFTTTVPAAGVGLFHYITAIEIIRSNPTATAVAGSAVNLAITTTNLPGSLAWHIGNALAAGAYDVPVRLMLNSPIRSSVANTATTIVCAAGGAGIQFQVNVYYYTGT